MSESERIERHKTFCLALHSEISQLADAVHYKDHRNNVTKTDRQKILYESIDIFRYFLSVVNLWGFDKKEVEDAFDSRDAFLWDRNDKPLNKWSGQPVAVVDIDDVISEFRKCFFRWINSSFGMSLDEKMPEYYYNGMCGDLTGEEAFMKFIEEGQLLNISCKQNISKFLKDLRSEGYWVQLLTARPGDNLKCVYDTYSWLRSNEIQYDNVAFDSEKYRWLSDKEFFKKGAIRFAIDDSPKNALEYAHHGIKVLVPRRSYNSSSWDTDNVFSFDWDSENMIETTKSLHE